jgi:homoserine kinase
VSLDRQPAGHAVEPADMVEPGQAVTVTVPATSANLGPGFDSLGLAVSLYDTVTVRTTVADGITVDVEGEGAVDVPRDASHLVVRTILDTLHRAGYDAPGLALQARNVIPHGRGLGSSAAAIVAGVLLARELVADGRDRFGDSEVLALASELEGHPDNVAACILGGLTVAWTERGRARAVRLTPVSGIVPVVFVPDAAVRTETARSLLPATVPHRDAAHNAGRAALLVAALTGRPDLLLAATEDRLHQSYRARVMPQTVALVDTLRARDLPAVVSGAGPSVLALVDEASAERVVEEAPESWVPLVLGIAEGAHVTPAT